MVELLVDAKRELLTSEGRVTVEDFETAWAAAWATMVVERAWPHAVEHRRQWRVAMLATKREARAAFVDEQTMFGALADSFRAAAKRLHYDMDVSELPELVLGAIHAGFSLVDEAEAGREELVA